MIKAISHACFSTLSLDETVGFYQRYLGARVVHEFRNQEGILYGVFLGINDSSFLEFFLAQEPIEAGTQFRHLCFEVVDINAMAEHLQSLGMNVDIRRGRTDGTLQFFIEDPNHVRIEFHQYDSGSKLRRF